MLTREEVIKLARLARIELSETEVSKFQKDLSTVLEYVDELKKVDVTGLEEVSQVTGLVNPVRSPRRDVGADAQARQTSNGVNVQRDDVAVEADNREEIFSQAPEMKDGYFKVKAIL